MYDIDNAVRLAAFAFLEHFQQTHGETLPYAKLLEGFSFDGRRVPLLAPQGIFKPAVLDLPLSITTTPPSPRKPRPYADEFDSSWFLRYKYRGEDQAHRDNVGLREVMRRQRPLVYFHGTVESRCMASWPVYIVGDDRATLTFTVAVDERRLVVGQSDRAPAAEVEIRRRYVTREVRQRLHQQAFRERVLEAYREHCAICRLRHHELLEVAHSLADSDPDGEPRVPNGLALCKLHHAAFDVHIIGVNPDCRVEVRFDVLNEVDGPMLKHGLQAFHGFALRVPSRDAFKPDRRFLEERYAMFRRAS